MNIQPVPDFALHDDPGGAAERAVPDGARRRALPPRASYARGTPAQRQDDADAPGRRYRIDFDDPVRRGDWYQSPFSGDTCGSYRRIRKNGYSLLVPRAALDAAAARRAQARRDAAAALRENMQAQCAHVLDLDEELVRAHADGDSERAAFLAGQIAEAEKTSPTSVLGELRAIRAAQERRNRIDAELSRLGISTRTVS